RIPRRTPDRGASVRYRPRAHTKLLEQYDVAPSPPLRLPVNGSAESEQLSEMSPRRSAKTHYPRSYHRFHSQCHPMKRPALEALIHYQPYRQARVPNGVGLVARVSGALERIS